MSFFQARIFENIFEKGRGFLATVHNSREREQAPGTRQRNVKEAPFLLNAKLAFGLLLFHQRLGKLQNRSLRSRGEFAIRKRQYENVIEFHALSGVHGQQLNGVVGALLLLDNLTAGLQEELE